MNCMVLPICNIVLLDMKNVCIMIIGNCYKYLLYKMKPMIIIFEYVIIISL